jgi:sugar (pentulose or hexulose) kinase
MSKSVIAIYDIGKTNKKLLLFDQKYRIIHEESRVFREISDDDGYPAEDLLKVGQWIKKSLKDIKKQDDLDIRAVNVSAYGASLVHLDEKGFPATPLYSYLKTFPDDLLEKFYYQYGGKECFSVQTASPSLGMLNSGLQFYWLKYKKPELFANIKRTLHLPQYFGYLLHKKTFSEMTSIGCHTGLWDFQNDRSHDWVYEEKLTSLFPPIVPTHSFKLVKSKLRSIRCGVGIHDSSAALVPYLMGFRQHFMLLSTGTWNITLNPFNQEPLTTAELSRDCLNYMDYRAKPVKASRVFLGNELAYQTGRLAEYFGKSEDYHRQIRPDKKLLIHLLQTDHTDEKKFYPQKMYGTGPLPDYMGPENDLGHFNSYEEAYHQLMLDLVSIQVSSLRLAQGNTRPDNVFVTGGFGSNQLFLQLLATLYREARICISGLKEASALGAAMVMHRHWNRENGITHLFEKFKPVEPFVIPELDHYAEKVGQQVFH